MKIVSKSNIVWQLINKYVFVSSNLLKKFYVSDIHLSFSRFQFSCQLKFHNGGVLFQGF